MHARVLHRFFFAKIHQRVKRKGFNPSLENTAVCYQHRLVSVEGENFPATAKEERQLQIHPNVEILPYALQKRGARKGVGTWPQRFAQLEVGYA